MSNDLLRLVAELRADPLLRSGSVHLESTSGTAEGLGAVFGEREAIVLRFGRPALRIRGGLWETPLLDAWETEITDPEGGLKKAIAAVGRVELHDPPLGFLGTAWMVTPTVAVTNRHVAGLFARRANGAFQFKEIWPGTPFDVRVDFLEESGGGSREFNVSRVLYLASADEPDLALLRLEAPTGEALPAPIPLLPANAFPLVKDHLIAAIGYPGEDASRHDAEDLLRYFGTEYGVKRLSPGRVLRSAGERFRHDCTTLKGSSGSAIVDLKTGKALGLHFSGTVGTANFALASWVVEDYLRRYVHAEAAAGVEGADPAFFNPPPDAEREGVDAEELWTRSGYQATFLGPPVPLPTPAPGVALEVEQPNGESTTRLDYHHYSVVLHASRRLALLTAVNIDGKRVIRVKRKSPDRWHLDPRLEKTQQWDNRLYWKNPFDRGHMVRRLDPAWGDTEEMARAAEKDTFYYTNATPQHEDMQRQGTDWAALENHILDSVDTEGFRASVFTAPILGENDPVYTRTDVPFAPPFEMRLPQAFWKVVVTLGSGGELSAIGFVLSQADLLVDLEFSAGELEIFQVPLAKLASLTGLAFDAVLLRADPMSKAADEATLAYANIVPIRGAEDIILGAR